jgi:diguanylate cyclase (GGDEF)-like protein
MYMRTPNKALATAILLDDLHIDPSLGVADRFGLGAVIERVQQHGQQHGGSAAYYVVGIDGTRLLEHVFGLSGRQAILQSLAQRLLGFAGDQGHVCWLGGDLFGVVMLQPNDIRPGAQAERILRQLGTAPWPHNAHVTVSIGAVAVTAPSVAAQEIIRAGEMALRAAKQAGRNTYHVHDLAAMAEEQNNQAALLHMAGLVQQALANHRLTLAYQPIVCSSTGTVLFYEALARMHDTDGTLLPAARFIPAVEAFGLAYALDCHVLELALAELRQHPQLRLAINITASTSESSAWAHMLEAALGERRDLAARLIIEITESQQIRDMAKARDFVAQARSLGGTIALDDFGAGHTSVQYATGLPVQLMKLDRALVHNIGQDTQQQGVLRALIALARSLGLGIIAEGVEDAATAAWLRHEQVEMQQGYHHGHPLPTHLLQAA